MILNDKIKDKLPINRLDNICVIADFDRTLTSPKSKNSWSVTDYGERFPDAYSKEAVDLFNYYRPIEMSEDVEYSYKLKMVEEWFSKRIGLFEKYKISKDVFDEVVSNLNLIKFRPKTKEFIEFLHNKNIPLIIFSAGLGNIIESFLDFNNCNFDNVYICSNKIVFVNGIASRADNTFIHSYNKNEAYLPNDIKEIIINKSNIILLGDQLGDLDMVDERNHEFVITVGFTTIDSSKELLSPYFDIVCEDNDTYDDLKNILFNES